MNNLCDYEGHLQTDKSGTLHIYGKNAFDQFFKDHPNQDFTMKIQLVPKNKSGRTVAYVFAEVVPKFIKGFEQLGEQMSKEDVLDFIDQRTKVNRKSYQEEGKIKHTRVSFNELEYHEKRRWISEAIIIAAEDLQIVIDEPI